MFLKSGICHAKKDDSMETSGSVKFRWQFVERRLRILSFFLKNPLGNLTYPNLLGGKVISSSNK